jgi:hypothetical protein
MKTFRMVATVIAATLIVGILSLIIGQSQEGNSAPLFTSQSLDDKSVDEIERYAIDYTQSMFLVNGDIEIRLSKAMNGQEATDIGLGVGNPVDDPRPYHAVILFGNFIKPADQQRSEEHYRYIAYVFDVIEGVPTTMIASSDGVPLKQALQDPSIPDPLVPLYVTPNPDIWKRFEEEPTMLEEYPTPAETESTSPAP